MPRLIDADPFREWWLENGENEYVYDTNCFLESIDEQPTIDAIPVVRCKDCRRLVFSDCYGECGMGYLGIVNPWDYCGHGERKDEEAAP